MGIAQTSRHVAVHAGHVLDVKTGKLLADQTLVIEDGKIVSSGAAAEAKIPADAVRIDLPNATVLPGLIDAHTHLTMDPKFGYERLAISVPREALTGAKNARLTLLAGFTTARNVGARGYHRCCFARRDQRRRRARAEDAGERAAAEHHRRTLRQQHAALRISRDQRRRGRWHGGVHHKVRENIKYGADLDQGHAPPAECSRWATIRSTRSTRWKK